MVMDNKRLGNLNSIVWIVVTASFLALFLMGPVIYDVPFRDSLRRIVRSIHRPNVNICSTGTFASFYFNQVIYCLWDFAVVMVILWGCLRKRMSFREMGHSVFRAVSIAVFVMFTLMQTSGMVLHGVEQNKVFYHLSDQQAKQRLWYGDIALFAEQIRGALPGKHNAQLVTGLDFHNNSENMFEQRKLAYFLYPIDIRDIRLGDKDVIVVLHKENPEQYVPSGYEIMVRRGDDSLAAVKRWK
jgi:hypothetical protein